MLPLYTASFRVRLVLLGATAGLLAAAAGCSYSHGDPAPACDVPHETITYAQVISPIFDANCRECHGSAVFGSKGGGNNFGDYAAIKRFPSNVLLGSIRHDPQADPMPQGRPKLSDCDIARIQAWVDNGQPNN